MADAHEDESQSHEVAAGSDATVTRGVEFHIAVTGPPPSVEDAECTGSGPDSESVADSNSN